MSLEPVALSLVLLAPSGPALRLEDEEPLGPTCWKLVMHEGRAAGQVLINLFLLGSARQRPKRGSDLWANLLMIYCWVLGLAPWHRLQPACLENLPGGHQGARGRKSSSQLPATATLNAQKGLRLFGLFSQSRQAAKQWRREGVGDRTGTGGWGGVEWTPWRSALGPARCRPRELEAQH